MERNGKLELTRPKDQTKLERSECFIVNFKEI
jgi:hypothetical protein